MTTTNSKTDTARPVARPEPIKLAARVEAPHERTRRIGREVGTLAVNVYERGVADVVAFEKDAAKITTVPWAKNALTMSAGLLEDVAAAYVRTARQVLR